MREHAGRPEILASEMVAERHGRVRRYIDADDLLDAVEEFSGLTVVSSGDLEVYSGFQFVFMEAPGESATKFAYRDAHKSVAQGFLSDFFKLGASVETPREAIQSS